MKTTMIYFRQLLALCVVLVAFAACGDDEKTEGGGSTASGIQLTSIDKITCLAEESTIDINFTAGGEWAATSNASWLKLGKLMGAAGDVTLTATISENETFDIRPATITIKDKGTGQAATISVKQAAKGTILFFSSESQHGKAFDNTKVSDDNAAFVTSVNVSSNYNWTLNTNKDWLSYTKAEEANEDGSYTVTFYADFEKLYKAGGYDAQNATAQFQYSSSTRTPATVDYQLEFLGITPSLTFDVEKAVFIDDDLDGEYSALVTVYSNIQWDFDAKPDFVESVEVLGSNNSAKFLPSESRVKIVFKNSALDTDELIGDIAFKDVTTNKPLEGFELPIEFPGLGDKYVTFDRSNFVDNDPSDMYPYFMFDATGAWNENYTEFSTERKVDITASNLDDIAIYTVNYDAYMDVVSTRQVNWLRNFEDDALALTTRSKLNKTTLVLKAEDRGVNDYSDPTPQQDRFCAVFIVSYTEYPDVFSLFDGNNQLREGLRDIALIVGQKGKMIDYSQFWCEKLSGDNVIIKVPVGGETYTYSYEGLNLEEVEASFISGDNLTIEDNQYITGDYNYSIGEMLINWGTGTGFMYDVEQGDVIKLQVGENSTGKERKCDYAIVANDGTEPGYVLAHFTIVQAAN